MRTKFKHCNRKYLYFCTHILFILFVLYKSEKATHSQNSTHVEHLFIHFLDRVRVRTIEKKLFSYSKKSVNEHHFFLRTGVCGFIFLFFRKLDTSM